MSNIRNDNRYTTEYTAEDALRAFSASGGNPLTELEAKSAARRRAKKKAQKQKAPAPAPKQTKKAPPVKDVRKSPPQQKRPAPHPEEKPLPPKKQPAPQRKPAQAPKPAPAPKPEPAPKPKVDPLTALQAKAAARQKEKSKRLPKEQPAPVVKQEKTAPVPKVEKAQPAPKQKKERPVAAPAMIPEKPVSAPAQKAAAPAVKEEKVASAVAVVVEVPAPAPKVTQAEPAPVSKVTQAEPAPAPKAEVVAPASVPKVDPPAPKAKPAAKNPQKGSQKTKTQAPPKSRKKNWIWIVALLIFCSVIAGTLIFLQLRKARAANDFKHLAQQVQEAEASRTKPTTAPTTPTEPVSSEEIPGETTEPVPTKPAVRTILPKYADLYLANTEFFGWIRVDGTKIDYPVMRSTMDNEKYLYANFDGEYSYAGIPFADNQCTSDSDNIMIYAHNIKDGSMFAGLFAYEDESFWEEHPTIMYSDLYEDHEYEVLAVFYDRVYLKTDTCFKFYQFIDAENEEDFDYAISQFKEKSIYDTGVDAQYGDQLITLVTCAYHVENGRFVVVARRK